MRNQLIVLLVLATAAFAMKGDMYLRTQNFEALSPELVDYVNSVQTSWVASKQSKYTADQIKGMLGAKQTPEEFKLPYREVTPLESIPDSFDPRDKWPQCESLFEVRDQANCGSCWAFGAAEAMSDRICIASQGKLQTRVSTQDLVSCCDECGDGCNGGYPDAAWQYWATTGIVTGDLYNVTNWCKPYALPPCDHHVVGTLKPCPASVDTPACERTCREGWNVKYDDDKTYGQTSFRLRNNVAQIQTELMTNGPVEVAFTVYADFPSYKSGVYHHVSGAALGGHAVKLIGWGVENNTPYWLVVNSWNEDWGDRGTFKIRRGNNECGIEDEVVSGLPRL